MAVFKLDANTLLGMDFREVDVEIFNYIETLIYVK